MKRIFKISLLSKEKLLFEGLGYIAFSILTFLVFVDYLFPGRFSPLLSTILNSALFLTLIIWFLIIGVQLIKLQEEENEMPPIPKAAAATKAASRAIVGVDKSLVATIKAAVNSARAATRAAQAAKTATKAANKASVAAKTATKAANKASVATSKIARSK